jgi:hypothetical protein
VRRLFGPLTARDLFRLLAVTCGLSYLGQITAEHHRALADLRRQGPPEDLVRLRDLAEYASVVADHELHLAELAARLGRLEQGD